MAVAAGDGKVADATMTRMQELGSAWIFKRAIQDNKGWQRWEHFKKDAATFDEIKKVYGTEYFNSDSSAEQAINIKALDVIDYSFSRTDIENVYTKVIFKYNWDYAKEEFLGTADPAPATT